MNLKALFQAWLVAIAAALELGRPGQTREQRATPMEWTAAHLMAYEQRHDTRPTAASAHLIPEHVIPCACVK